MAAGVYEVGRPARLSGAQAAALDAQWVDFRAFADARLARKGRCHASEVELAYRRFSPTYNARRREDAAANAAGDADLRNFIANWSPAGACCVRAAVTSRMMLQFWLCADAAAVCASTASSREDCRRLLQGNLTAAGGGAGGAAWRRELRGTVCARAAGVRNGPGARLCGRGCVRAVWWRRAAAGRVVFGCNRRVGSKKRCTASGARLSHVCRVAPRAAPRPPHSSAPLPSRCCTQGSRYRPARPQSRCVRGGARSLLRLPCACSVPLAVTQHPARSLHTR